MGDVVPYVGRAFGNIRVDNANKSGFLEKIKLYLSSTIRTINGQFYTKCNARLPLKG